MSLAVYSDTTSLLRDVPALGPLVEYLDGLKEGRADLDRLRDIASRWYPAGTACVISSTITQIFRTGDGRFQK